MSQDIRSVIDRDYGLERPNAKGDPVVCRDGLVPYSVQDKGIMIRAFRLFQGEAGAGTYTMQDIVIPANSLVMGFFGVVVESFDGTTAVIDVGLGDDPDALIDNQDVQAAPETELTRTAAGIALSRGTYVEEEHTITGVITTTGVPTAVGGVMLAVEYLVVGQGQAALSIVGQD